MAGNPKAAAGVEGEDSETVQRPADTAAPVLPRVTRVNVQFTPIRRFLTRCL